MQQTSFIYYFPVTFTVPRISNIVFKFFSDIYQFDLASTGHCSVVMFVPSTGIPLNLACCRQL